MSTYKLTSRQQAILDELRRIGRHNANLQRERSPHLFNSDMAKLARGDEACVFGLGGLTFQVGHRLNIKAAAVLSVFKALEAKGLVIRETRNPDYQRPLYWWPVGFSAELHAELSAQPADGVKSDE